MLVDERFVVADVLSKYNAFEVTTID